MAGNNPGTSSYAGYAVTSLKMKKIIVEKGTVMIVR
jgi:hypothetical protein